MALAGVTTLLILLNGLATGIRETLLHTATTLTSGHLNVAASTRSPPGRLRRW
jgi:hypothetical protein